MNARVEYRRFADLGYAAVWHHEAEDAQCPAPNAQHYTCGSARTHRPWKIKSASFGKSMVDPFSLFLCWRAGSRRRRLCLRLRGHGLRRSDGNAVETPLVVNHLEHASEINLLRPRGDVADEMRQADLVERRHSSELGCQKRGAVKIEFPPSQVGKTLPEIRGGVARLEIGRGEVAQHCVVARAVGVVEGQQGRANEIESLLDAHRHCLLLRRGRCWRGRCGFWRSRSAGLWVRRFLLCRRVAGDTPHK